MDQQFIDDIEEANRRAEQLIQDVEQMKRAFSVLGDGDWICPTVQDLLEKGHHWESWYAWRPVRDIHSTWHWLTDIYRLRGNTYVDQEDWNWYYYGTVFDILDND